MRKFIYILMLVALTSCSGPSNKNDTCIPSRGQSQTQDLDGQESASIEQIDQKIKDAKIISTIVTKIKSKVVGDEYSFSAASQLFDGFVSSPMFQGAVSAAFMLFVIIYGILVIGGMVQGTVGELVIRVAKVAFITYFALNWADFYSFIGKASMDFTDEMMSYFLESFSRLYINLGPITMQNYPVFEYLDDFIAKMFSMKMIAMFSALISSGGPTGPGYALLLFFGMFYVFKGIIHVVLVYCFSLFARAMLFAVAPIFLTFMLFKPTSSLFDSWVKQLFNYSLQPVLVAVPVGFFIALLMPFFNDFLKYELCWKAIDASKEVYSWVFINPQTGNRVDLGINSEPVVEIQRILLFFAFGYIFNKSIVLGEKIATGVTGTVAGNLYAAAQNLGGVGELMGNNKMGKMMSRF